MSFRFRMGLDAVQGHLDFTERILARGTELRQVAPEDGGTA
jgi:hypothetical protein